MQNFNRGFYMKIGIICAMDEETEYFLSKLEKL